MPQQAVTKGYTNIEYLRAQPIALSNFEVMKPGPSPELISISIPILWFFARRSLQQLQHFPKTLRRILQELRCSAAAPALQHPTGGDGCMFPPQPG